MRYARFVMFLALLNLGLHIGYSTPAAATKKTNTKKSKGSGRAGA